MAENNTIKLVDDTPTLNTDLVWENDALERRNIGDKNPSWADNVIPQNNILKPNLKFEDLRKIVPQIIDGTVSDVDFTRFGIWLMSKSPEIAFGTKSFSSPDALADITKIVIFNGKNPGDLINKNTLEIIKNEIGYKEGSRVIYYVPPDNRLSKAFKLEPQKSLVGLSDNLILQFGAEEGPFANAQQRMKQTIINEHNKLYKNADDYFILFRGGELTDDPMQSFSKSGERSYNIALHFDKNLTDKGVDAYYVNKNDFIDLNSLGLDYDNEKELIVYKEAVENPYSKTVMKEGQTVNFLDKGRVKFLQDNWITISDEFPKEGFILTDTPKNVVDEGIELFHSRSKGIDTPRDFHAGTYQAAIDRSAFMFGDTNMYQLIKNTQELAQEQVNDMLSEIVSDSTGKFQDGKYLEREILVDLPNGNQQPVNILVETIDDTGGYKVMILDKDNFGFTIYSEDGFGESPANKSLLEVNGNAVLVGEADDTFGYVAGFKPENKTFNYKDGYELYKVEIKPNANVVTFTENIELVENGVKQNIDPDLFVNYLEMNLLTDIDSITLPDGKTIDLQGLSDTEKRNKLKNNIDVIGYRNQMEDVGSTSYYFLNNDAYTETLVDNATNNKFDNDVLKKFIDTNPNVGITDFKRASDERLNIVTDLLSSKPDTPDRPFGPGAAHIEEILNANTQLVNELPLSQTVKNQFDNFLRTRARNLATPGGAIDAIDIWELGITGLMITAIAYKEFDEIPTIFKRTATNMFNSMTAPYNIPPVPLEEYDLDYEFINKVLSTGEKVMPTDIIIKKVGDVVKGAAETGAVTGFGYVPPNLTKTDTMETTQKIQPGVQEEKMFEQAKPKKSKATGGAGAKIL